MPTRFLWMGIFLIESLARSQLWAKPLSLLSVADFAVDHITIAVTLRRNRRATCSFWLRLFLRIKLLA